MRLKTEYFLRRNRDEATLLSLSKWGVRLNSECGLKLNYYGYPVFYLVRSGQSYAVLGGEKPVSLELMAFLRVFSMLEGNAVPFFLYK